MRNKVYVLFNNLKYYSTWFGEIPVEEVWYLSGFYICAIILTKGVANPTKRYSVSACMCPVLYSNKIDSLSDDVGSKIDK